MSAEILYFRDYQKPVEQPASLLAQASSLVEFINALTAQDMPKVNPDFKAPDGDCA